MGSRHDRRAVRTFVARPFGTGVILYTRNFPVLCREPIRTLYPNPNQVHRTWEEPASSSCCGLRFAVFDSQVLALHGASPWCLRLDEGTT